MEKLSGPFKDIIPNFQKYKKSLGYKYNNINLFRKLDESLSKKGIKDLKDTKIIYDILITNENNYSTKKRNYHLLLQLYNFMHLIGYENMYFEILYFNDYSDFKPTILTNNQLKKFYSKLDDYCKNLQYPENYIYPVLYRLIFSNGLRISEALNIRTSDFSLENKRIFISESKENVSRELPISKSMVDILNIYLGEISILNNMYLFEIDKKKISYNKAKRKFKDVLENLDFSFRIHDLRHTMAVTTFNNLYDKGYNETWILYYLHFYLGHKSYESTERYLRYTKSRYKKAVKTITKKYPNIYPEMRDKYE